MLYQTSQKLSSHISNLYLHDYEVTQSLSGRLKYRVTHTKDYILFTLAQNLTHITIAIILRNFRKMSTRKFLDKIESCYFVNISLYRVYSLHLMIT